MNLRRIFLRFFGHTEAEMNEKGMNAMCHRERILLIALTAALIAILVLIASMLISMRGMQPARPAGCALVNLPGGKL